MYITVDDIKMKSPLIIQLTIGMEIKKLALFTLTLFTVFIMSKRMKRSTLRMVHHYQLKEVVTLRKT